MKITNQKLTRNQEIVLNLLENSGEPLKAYTILSDTQKKADASLRILPALRFFFCLHALCLSLLGCARQAPPRNI